MSVSIAETASAKRSAQLAELPVHFRLDVERLLALPHAPLVARDHELAHLVAEPLVGGRGGRHRRELRDLGIHVERRLPAGDAARRLRLDELADLLVGLCLGGRAARLRAGAALLLVPVHRQPAAPDPLVQAAAGHRRSHRDDDRKERDPDDHDREGVGHTYSVPMWRRLRRRTMAPSRPAMFPEQLGLVLLSLAAIGAGVYLFVRLLTA